jgi:plastocyanin
MMKRLSGSVVAGSVLVFVAVPLLAGDIHGKVECKGLSDSGSAVVYVATLPLKAFAAPKQHATIDQASLKFVPHVLPVLIGTTVDFLNSDSVTHNVFTPDACAGKFNLGTWPKGQSRSYTFTKECFATLLCLVHPEMEGFVAALPTPYFAVTAADGSYRIADVPDGSYTVKAWHPKLKATAKTVAIQGTTAADFLLSK